MTPERLVKVSKYLAKHLRHQPEALGLTLEPGGWVPVADLLAGCAARNFALTRAELETVVAENDKQRFSFSDDGTKIRANQGHSTEVDLDLPPADPPTVLYHGTGAQYVEAIRREGLSRQRRHHVHLSADHETARRVGARHGRPHVFAIETAPLLAAGHTFYVSANGVWLVDEVPPEFL
jgi:putative RNA 2'-phosphotransferase